MLPAQEPITSAGSIPPRSTANPVGQLDAIFRLAAEHDVGIDIHLHDPAELGAFQFDLIIDRTRALGREGRVNIAHGFALAQVDDLRRRDLLAAMGELDITLTTVAPLRLPQLPLHELDAAGVAFGFGTDGIRDLWSPYGTGDLLGIAWQYARASSIVRDEDLIRVLELATARQRASSAAAPTIWSPALAPTSCCSTPRTRWTPSCALRRAHW